MQRPFWTLQGGQIVDSQGRTTMYDRYIVGLDTSATFPRSVPLRTRSAALRHKSRSAGLSRIVIFCLSLPS